MENITTSQHKPKKYNYTKKAGRPAKMDKVDLNQVKTLVINGFTDDEIAEFLGMNRVSFCRYKKSNQKFSDILKQDWKKEADKRV